LMVHAARAHNNSNKATSTTTHLLATRRNSLS
jgi:hypothetical protein